MTLDVIHSPKRSWKASQADYDDVFSRSDRLCSVCLTEQQIVALLSMTEFLYWPTRWVKAEGDVDRSIVTEFAERLERNLMMACCDDNLPIQYRYGTDGTLERSLNGGQNWMDAPQYDPRVYSPQYPPMTGDDGDDKKCTAAQGAADLVKAQVGSQLTDDMTRYTLAQLITDWVATMLQTSNPFQALLNVVVNQIFVLVISLLIPALTDDTYDLFKCTLYCNMADDASVNDEQWQNIRADIVSQISGIAGVFFEHLIYLLGTTGTTNLLRAGGAASGDCSDCICDDSCAALYTETDGFGIITDRGSNWVEVQSTYQTSPFGYNMARLRAPTLAGGECCTMTGYTTITGTAPAPTGGDAPFPDHQGSIAFPKDLCWIQFEQDGVESPFKVRINFL